MYRFALLAMFLGATTMITGCGSSRDARPQVKPSLASTWKAWGEFSSEGTLQGINKPAQDKLYDQMVPALIDPKFEASLKKLEDAPLPSGFSGDKYKGYKDAYIAAYKELIAEAKGKKNKKTLGTLYKKVQDAQANLTSGKSPEERAEYQKKRVEAMKKEEEERKKKREEEKKKKKG